MSENPKVFGFGFFQMNLTMLLLQTSYRKKASSAWRKKIDGGAKIISLHEVETKKNMIQNEKKSLHAFRKPSNTSRINLIMKKKMVAGDPTI